VGFDPRGRTETFATITLQNYFRLYDKLCPGMDGHGADGGQEFMKIYKIPTVRIPTKRTDSPADHRHDAIYKTRRQVEGRRRGRSSGANQIGQPVLVGTISGETSEMLAGELKRRGRSTRGPQAPDRGTGRARGKTIAQAGRKACRHDRPQTCRPRRRHQTWAAGQRACTC